MSLIIKYVDNLPAFMNDVPEIIRAFYPFITLDEDSQNCLNLSAEFDKESLKIVANCGAFGDFKDELSIKFEESLLYRRLTKRFVKNFLYGICKKLTNVDLPYGSLTGVRPTKLFYELLNETNDPKSYLIDNFFVTKQKADLIESVVKRQSGIYSSDKKNADFYVNIPFCPTRCKYCSFISTEVFRIKKQLPTYLNLLNTEIKDKLDKLNEGGFNLRSIYVGGGTPTVLSAEELYKTLSPLSNLGVEFSVECGRPDSITKEKLDALKRLGVTRISVNPQTFNQKTLDYLGRNHTIDDIYTAYDLAKEYGFDINMDLIAGLFGEDFDMFKDTIKKTLSLCPQNITIHTLSIKRGAAIRNEGAQKSVSGLVSKMTDYAGEKLLECGYNPYYMYRQKNMADNLENVGYAKLNKECVYNIDYMEEISTIFAAGCGAVSKFIYWDEGRSERASNPKDLNEYIKRFSKEAL